MFEDIDIAELTPDIDPTADLTGCQLETLQLAGFDLDGDGWIDAVLGSYDLDGDGLADMAIIAVDDLDSLPGSDYLDTVPASPTDMDPFLANDTFSRMDWPGGDSLYTGGDGNTSYFMDSSTGYSVIPGEGVSH